MEQKTLKYNYDRAKNYSNSLNLVWMEDWIEPADKEFEMLELTQEQVDGLMWMWCWRVKHLATAKNYSYWSRLKIAFYFITGLGKK